MMGAVGDRHKVMPGTCVDDLVGAAPSHGARADHADADGAAFRCALFQRFV
jgi:hypothetical protein